MMRLRRRIGGYTVTVRWISYLSVLAAVGAYRINDWYKAARLVTGPYEIILTVGGYA